MDTIFALASAQGKAGVSVIRLSGPQAHHTVSRLTGSDVKPRGMGLRPIFDLDGQVLDRAIVLTFEGPASFTGEDVAELQVHGSTALISGVLRLLSQQEGLRSAEPGEFTRRALENGRLDLTQVEALADLIDAETEAQRRQAQRVLSGDLGDMVDRWRVDLIRAAALIEATIDFADEEVPTDVTPEVNALLERVGSELALQASGVGAAERIRSGFEVAIVGPPNVGKSTLLNALAGRKAAITSEFAGTTRDVIEVRMDIEGLPVTLLDTAGLRDTTDTIEGIGIDLAKDRAGDADLRVFLAESLEEVDIEAVDGDILMHPKADQRADKRNSVSGMSGEGVSDLIAQIASVLMTRARHAGVATRERHRAAMLRANEALGTATELLKLGPDHYDLAAEELRTAIRALEGLVGRVDVENLLDEIFASFCLGK